LEKITIIIYTLGVGHKGESGKFLRNAMAEKANAEGKSKVNLSSMQGRGLKLFNTWTGDNVQDDYAWLKRDNLVQALEMNPTAKNKLLITEYKKEMSVIESKHKELMKHKALGEETFVPEDNTIKRAFLVEEYELANHVQGILTKYNYNKDLIPLKELDPVELGNSIYNIKHPKDYSPSSKTSVIKEAFKTNKYSRTYLDKLIVKKAVSRPEGLKVLEERAKSHLNFGSQSPVSNITSSLKSSIGRLLTVGLRKGIDKSEIKNIANMISRMGINADQSPIHQLAVENVIAGLNKRVENLNMGNITKETQKYFTDPEKAIEADYKKTLKGLESEAYGNLVSKHILPEDKSYSEQTIGNINNSYKQYRNSLYNLAHIKSEELKDVTTYMPITDLAESLEKSAGKKEPAEKSLKSLKKDRDNAYLGQGLSTTQKHFNILADVLKTASTSISKDSLEVLFNNFLRNKNLLPDLGIEEKTKKLNSLKFRYESAIDVGDKHKALNLIDSLKTPKLDKEGLDILYWNKDIKYMNSLYKNKDPEKFNAAIKQRIKQLASDKTFLPDKDYSSKLTILSNLANSLKSNHFGSLESSFAQGVKKFAIGGYIPGHSIKDDVPALLQRGEAVLSQKTVRDLGLNSKASFDRFTKAASDGKVKYFSAGGLTEEELKNLGATQDKIKKYLEATKATNPTEEQKKLISETDNAASIIDILDKKLEEETPKKSTRTKKPEGTENGANFKPTDNIDFAKIYEATNEPIRAQLSSEDITDHLNYTQGGVSKAIEEKRAVVQNSKEWNSLKSYSDKEKELTKASENARIKAIKEGKSNLGKEIKPSSFQPNDLKGVIKAINGYMQSAGISLSYRLI